MENMESGNGDGSLNPHGTGKSGNQSNKKICFEVFTDNSCSCKTFHLDTLYSFSYCRLLFNWGKIYLQEFHIHMMQLGIKEE